MTLGAEFRKRYVSSAPTTHRSFREYVSVANPRYRWYRHCELLADELQQVADGTITRLMVFMPPRHGKSELVSRLFPGYFLERHPERFVGLSSYAAGLAFTLSRNAREAFTRAGNALSPSAQGVEQWETTAGGGLWSAGVGGPITGKGAHLAIIDDPIKNAEEANSETIRDGHREWFRSTLYTRLEPDAAMIVLQTRWHEDDLSGWLLSLEQSEDEYPEGWTILNLTAIADAVEDRQTFPVSCDVLSDWRQPGEALWPERYPVERLRRSERKIGPYYFGALYQQHPTAADGDVFKRDWWQFYTVPGHPMTGVRILPPSLARVIQSWDMSFKDTDGTDFVSGQVWGQLHTDQFLLDRVNERMGFSASCSAVESLTGKWPQARGKYIEDKANGPAVINALRRRVHGLVPVKPDGGKIARAYAVQPIVEARQCWLPHPSIAPWVEDFIRQCSAFPRGVHDDDVDAMTQALNILSRSSKVEQPEDVDEAEETIPQSWYTATAERDRKLPRRTNRPIDSDFGAY